jgi:hypothetical protein
MRGTTYCLPGIFKDGSLDVTESLKRLPRKHPKYLRIQVMREQFPHRYVTSFSELGTGQIGFLKALRKSAN